MPGPPPRGDRAATPAERAAAYRARRKAAIAAAPTKPPVVVRYRRPADRRTQLQRWADAIQTLTDYWTAFRNGGTTCPQASKAVRRQKRSMLCWSCAVMLKTSRRSTCQKASDGTDFTQPWRYSSRAKKGLRLRGRPHKTLCLAA